jgi:hypothetical protein
MMTLRRSTTLSLLLAALACSGCAMFNTPLPADKSAAGAAAKPAMCVHEGESCTAKGATCCNALLCVGIRESVCMQGY